MPWIENDLTWSYATLEDLDEIAAMLAKPSVCEHVYFGPNTSEETRDYFEPLVKPMQEALATGETPDAHIFTIRSSDDGSFVGQCALVSVAFGTGNFTIGYQFDEPAWGRGYGSRACEFLVWYGFDVLDARRLSGDCLATNAASARIMEKSGFTPEGALREYYLVDGEPRDNLHFGLLRSEVGDDRLADLRDRFDGHDSVD
jgi:ribosomal-protein-alanine N-acetyltransferase